MPRHLAFVVCVLFIGWLLAGDRRKSKDISAALWIPQIWLLILASRPVSMWFGAAAQDNSAEAYLEGSPLDRAIFLALIAAGLCVLWQRRLAWGLVVSRNRWLFAFFLWLGISVAWSEYPLVAFKRWIKDLGNVIMVLVLLSEREPAQAVKALFLRCACILIPLSVFYIKYDANIGRYYDRWSGHQYFGGVTTNKNLLGMLLAVIAIFLAHRIFMEASPRPGRVEEGGLGRRKAVLLGLLTVWLFTLAKSSTAIVCALLGLAVLFTARTPRLQPYLRRLGLVGLLLLSLAAGAHYLLNAGGLLVGLLGRDLTFTGRTDIWGMLMAEKTDPLLGAGFYSFWLGDRAERLSEKYAFHLNEAHNGYLETYLNSGLIGLGLLGLVLVSVGGKLSRQAAGGHGLTAIRLALFLITLVYSLTESIYNRLNPVWFAFLFAVIQYPPAPRRPAPRRSPSSPTEPTKPSQQWQTFPESYATD